MEMYKNAFFRLPAMHMNGLEMCVDGLKITRDWKNSVKNGLQNDRTAFTHPHCRFKPVLDTRDD